MLLVLLFALFACSAAVNLPGVPAEFSTDNVVLSAITDDIASKLEKEYIAFMKTGVESASLRQISAQLAKSHSKRDIFTKEISELSSADQFFLCTTCRATVNIAARMFREEDGELNGPDAEAITKKIMVDFCIRFEIQTEEVCAGLFESNYPTADFIIHNSIMDSRSFCSLFLEFSYCNVKNKEYDWTLNIDKTAPAITGPKSNNLKKQGDDFHILHLTDIHLDILYEPGTLAECDEPQCCQRHKDVAEGTSKAAGHWGDYRDCDLPWHTFVNALEHIKETHSKIDFIYQTGDVVDHMVWATSVNKNNDILSRVNNKLAEIFPDVPVYSCIGNHEPHPLNVFSPDDAPNDISTKWLYEHLYNDWSKWITSGARDTMLKGGYYTVSPKSGFRIVALNNNDCYNMNWWLFYKGTDKIPQLQWLHDTLLAAEKAGEYVHILAHIPSGDGSCWSVWSREYNRIIERFYSTLSGIFNGHSHKDEMNVHYSANHHAVLTSWNGGSLTPFSYKNPNYRIYHVNSKSMEVVDHETWIFDLNEANERGPEQTPNWFKEYDFTSEFTDNLSPAGIDALLDRMAENPELLEKFWWYKMTSSTPLVSRGCGRSCLMGTLCRLATTVNDQKDRCEALQAKLALALDGDTTTASTTSSTSIGTTVTVTGGTSTTGSTSIPQTTTTPTTEKPDPEDGGASSIVAFRISFVLGLYLVIKYLF